jgi:hypothetical protein
MPRICQRVRRGAWHAHGHTTQANLGVGGCFLPLHGLGGGDSIKLRLQRLKMRQGCVCSAPCRWSAHLQAALQLVSFLGGCSRSFQYLQSGITKRALRSRDDAARG